MKFTIATRESRLALWQANHVAHLLRQQGHTVDLLPMTTRGDQILDRALSAVGGKGLFVKELELALQQGQADLAVHSLKDVPMELPLGFSLACVLQREDPRDAWVSPLYPRLELLPPGALIGTSSLRRQVLLRALLAKLGREDIRIEPLRGNLDTRLRKLDGGLYQGIVLAAAGLQRLQLQARIASVFEPEVMLPAPGQGALAIETLSAFAQRTEVAAALGALAHQPTGLAVAAERALSRALGGSCSLPLAGHAVFMPGTATLALRAALGDTEGQAPLRQASASAEVRDQPQAQALGERVAAQLRA